MSISSNPVRSAISLGVGFTVFLAVFLLVVITTTLVTFILPETYASVARIRLDLPTTPQNADTNAAPTFPGFYDSHLLQTEFEVIQSEIVLRRVIENLDLNVAWGKQYAGGETLKTTESLELLKTRLDLRPVRGTSLVQIRVFSENPTESAELANAVAESYGQYLAESGCGVRVEIVDRAHPPLRPARPNKPLNITLAVGVGLAFGAGCGLFCVWATARIGRCFGNPAKPG
jgi:uncharacterized protein involved in exopolysaccharide biosynthesis